MFGSLSFGNLSVLVGGLVNVMTSGFVSLPLVLVCVLFILFVLVVLAVLGPAEEWATLTSMGVTRFLPSRLLGTTLLLGTGGGTTGSSGGKLVVVNNPASLCSIIP